MPQANRRRAVLSLGTGLAGAVLIVLSDWLMIFGDAAYDGELFWLTEGVKNIPAWRSTLALVIFLPGVIFCAGALFSLEPWLKPGKRRAWWRYLTAYSLIPWLALHLLFMLILFLYAWLSQNGFAAAALPACTALFRHFYWLIPAGSLLIVLPFGFWLLCVLRGQSFLPRPWAAANPLIFFLLLVPLRLFLPQSPWRPALANSLMSLALFFFFLALLWAARRQTKNA